MQEPICPLCRSSSHRKSFSLHGWDLLSCGDCGLFFIHPYPTAVAAAAAKSQGGSPAMPPATQRLYDVQFYKRHFAFIDGWCRGAKSVLDVGCGTGMLLELLGARGDMLRVGLEPNAEKAAFAARSTGCQIHQTPIEQFTADATFDVVTLINVLSHVRSLDDLFASLRSLLSPGGKVILKTAELEPDVRRGDVRDWSLGRHLQFLGTSTMDHICRRHALDVLARERRPYSHELFSRESFSTPGSSPARRVIKKLIAAVPLALPALARCHELAHGRRVWSSFIVLATRNSRAGRAGP